MEVEPAPSQLVSSPTLESFEDYMAVYARFVPERLKVEKRLSEIKEYGKQKRVKKNHLLHLQTTRSGAASTSS